MDYSVSEYAGTMWLRVNLVAAAAFVWLLVGYQYATDSAWLLAAVLYFPALLACLFFSIPVFIVSCGLLYILLSARIPWRWITIGWFIGSMLTSATFFYFIEGFFSGFNNLRKYLLLLLPVHLAITFLYLKWMRRLKLLFTIYKRRRANCRL